MAIDILKPIWWLLTFGYNLECNLYIFHFFLYDILSESVTFFSSLAQASLTILGSSSSTLWALFRHQALCHLTMDIILSLFFRKWWTHQLNAGSCWMPWAMEYSATWIGCNSLRLDIISHNVDLSFHLHQMSQPAVDFQGFLAHWQLPFGPLYWELNHSFCDWWMLPIIGIHSCWHHTGHILTLQWYWLLVQSFLP